MTTDALEGRIHDLIDDWCAMTQQMAADCRTDTGAPRCYVCHRTDGLRCSARGWGGVWVCDDCGSQ